MASETLDVQQLRMIPLVFAGWLRYLMAVDDDGNAFTPEPGPDARRSAELCRSFPSQPAYHRC